MTDPTVPFEGIQYKAALKLLGLDRPHDADNCDTLDRNSHGHEHGHEHEHEHGHQTTPRIHRSEIQQAYRRLARVHHPDRGGDAPSFLRLTAAKDLLLHQHQHQHRIHHEHDIAATDQNQHHDAPNAKASWSDGGSLDVSSQVLLLRQRTSLSCVRDLVAGYHDAVAKKHHAILVATDDGLKVGVRNIDCAAGGVRGKHTFQWQNVYSMGSSSPKNEKPAPIQQQQSQSVLCCAMSCDGMFAFAGDANGHISRYDISDQAFLSQNGDDSTMKRQPLVAFAPLGPSVVESVYHDLLGCGATTIIPRVVSLEVRSEDHTGVIHKGSSSSHQENGNVVLAAYQIGGCQYPAAVAMFRFQRDSVQTLWQIFADPNGTSDLTGALNPLRGIQSIDTLLLCPSRVEKYDEEPMECGQQSDHVWNVWMGGSNDSNEAVLVHWNIGLSSWSTSTTANQEDFQNTCSLSSSMEDAHDESWGSEDSFDSDNNGDELENSRGGSGMHNILPNILHAMNNPLGSGSIYSMDRCLESGLLAATVGSDVILLETHNHKDSDEADAKMGKCPPTHDSSYQIQQRLKTNGNTLYCVKVLSSSKQIATCGADESIFIWSWSHPSSSSSLPSTSDFPTYIHLQHRIQLNSNQQCNLCTNCIMALDWFIDIEEDEDEDAGDGRRHRVVVSIVSGGYDGTVTRWWWVAH